MRRKRMRFGAAWGVSLVVLGVMVTPIASAQKVPLDHGVYDGWKTIRSTAVSRDGAWVLYVVAPQEGDAEATIESADRQRKISIPRASTIQFSKDSKHVIALAIPPFADTRKARRAKAKPEDMPKSALVLLDLATGVKRQVDEVQSFSLPEEDSGYVLYKPEPPKETPKPAAAPAKPSEDDEEDQRQGRRAAAGGTAGARGAAATDAKKGGEPYVLLNLSTGKEERIEDVGSFAFDRGGDVLAYSVKSKDGKADKVVYYDLRTQQRTTVLTATGHYPKLALSPDGRAIAFTSDKDDAKAKKPSLSLYVFESGRPGVGPDHAKFSEAHRIGLDSMPKDWSINEGGALEFSHGGRRLLYRTSPKPVPDPDPKPDDENVSVDIWNWRDEKLQTQQVIDAKAERERGYLAVYDVPYGKSMQVGDRATPDPTIGDRGDGPYALAIDTHPYDREASWGQERVDVYSVDLETGKKSPLAQRFLGQASLSVGGKYASLYDGAAKEWTAVDLATGRRVSLSKAIPVSMADELDDHPDVAPSYGIAGWTAGDARAIVADRFDLWSCDPTGATPPIRLTHGRDRSIRFRPIRLDPDARFLDLANLPLSAFNEDTKWDGVARLAAPGRVETIVSAPKTFAGFAKAKDADTLVYTRQDFVEFPDLWLTKGMDFAGATKISEANPQQSKYIWGSSELVRWTSLDGIPLQGLLIKPGNFDYGKKYPLISYFYERSSDNLYRYSPPAPSASTINLSLFASNGYCLFVPDIPYKIGYPGESAINAILPGIQSILGRGYIDPKRMGIQGQSWGGYQVAYMVTRTNMFACAEAGAPVSDMFSAYGGIRYGSGVVREGQYEHGQSRIGGTPWDSTLRYIENSPVFWADKIQTPLMIMSNDKDGAVPHTQGIELFTAMRRLDKTCWMVVYNDEDHNLVQRKNRKDLSIRLSQFFDHYLKGAPMPIWMSKGLPAVDKGRTMGTGF